eukprot:Mycagemm_TRINITY_DN10305_c1_g1::TRINITY_DN10305_c1_g1_i1::g.1295::m.1295 type:complete len:107 gc:universal TRINITY_DN10305_c1_g1_i1:650-330(-)
MSMRLLPFLGSSLPSLPRHDLCSSSSVFARRPASLRSSRSFASFSFVLNQVVSLLLPFIALNERSYILSMTSVAGLAETMSKHLLMPLKRSFSVMVLPLAKLSSFW